MIDLHTHSTKSDGTLTPSELVDYAIRKGLSAFALTDHDSVAGLEEAIEYSSMLKEKGINAPEVVPGIEFSTEYEGRDVHIVGLFINYKEKSFTDYLKTFIDSRENRNRKMCDMMVKDGINMPYEDLIGTYKDCVITRAHMMSYMVEHNIVKSRQEALDKYIGDNSKYFLPREKITPKMAIELILKADGIPILAHPMLYHLTKKKLDKLVGELKEAGLMGIEAIYATYSASDERVVRELANKYHLLLSGGSDFHGSNKPNIDLGTGFGKLYLDDEILVKQKAALKNLLFTDMDGTLLLKDSTVSPAMKEALDTLTSKGHRFILSSGRPLPSILERKVNLGFNYPNMYIISNNGGLIYDCDANKSIRVEKLSPELIRKVVALADEAGIHVHSYSDTEIVGYEEDEEVKFYRSRVKMPLVLTDDIAGYLKDGAFKVQIISLTSKESLVALERKILDALGDEVEAFFSNDYYLEVLPKGTSKGNSVLFLANYLSAPISHTFAAGDEDNDLSMIIAAGHGIAMKNATEKVKAAADIITKEDNNHDGLIEIINEYFQ